MTWPRGLTYVCVWLLLTTAWAVQRRSVPEAEPPSSPAKTPFGDLKPPDVVGIEIASSGQTLAARLADGRWEVSRPPGATLAADLIPALLDAVLDVEEIKTVRPVGTGHAEFGLADPLAHLTFRAAGGASLRILLGGLNPAQTAIYGRAEGASEVVLLGLNVRYYLRMALQATASHTPTSHTGE